MGHAIVAQGGSLELVEVEVAPPGPGEVTISVRAAGVNPVDRRALDAEDGTRVGRELAGVVTAVGADAVGAVGHIAVGDEVIAYPVVGGYADEVTVPATSVFPRPETLSWAQSANLMLVGVTAAHLLAATGVAGGDRVLIHGASGGVGLTAVQLAAALGAEVVGTASAANQQLVEDHGARAVVYGEGLADRVRELFPDGVDVALDTVGTDEAIDVSLDLVADRQRIATIAGFRRGAETGIQLLGGGPGADPGREIRTAARATLVERAAEGKLDVIVGRVFPLAEAAAAFELVATGHPGGQVALMNYVLHSRAVVATERPERWAKQLVSHFSHKVAVTGTPEGDRVEIGGGLGIVRVEPGQIVLEARAVDAAALARVEDVLGRHLERFAAKDALVVEWARD